MMRVLSLRRFHWIIIFICLSSIYFWVLLDSITKHFSSLHDQEQTHESSSVNEPSTSIPLVLLWTDLFGSRYWHQESYFNASNLVQCSSMYYCRFSRQREQLKRASIVGFHLYDLTRGELPERDRTRHDNQTWVFVTGESPLNFYYQNPSFYPHLFDNYFDRSISYKFESPFPIFSATLRIRSIESSLQERNLNAISLKKKKKPIAWIVSNCATFSRRETFVEELSKWIEVDIHGRCGNKCATDRQCHINLDDYYFYLSFENSRCNSYITEKFWNILTDKDHRLVPIVMGPRHSDYARIAPNHSFIHVDDYSTPEKLALYLRSLISNPDAFLAYLKWRELFDVQPPTTGGWMNFLCPLCQMAHDPVLLPSNRLQFSTWFNPSSECHHEDVQVFKTCKQTTLNVWMGWIHGARCP